MFTIIMEKKNKKLCLKQRSVSFKHRHYIEENDYETEYNSLDGLKDLCDWILDTYETKVSENGVLNEIIFSPKKMEFSFYLDDFNYHIFVIKEKDNNDLKKFSSSRNSNLIYWQIGEDLKKLFKQKL